MADREALQAELSELKSLQQRPGYKELMRLADVQIANRRNLIELVPLKSLDETLAQEYAKGEISGIRLFQSMVEVQKGNLELEIKEASDEQKTV